MGFIISKRTIGFKIEGTPYTAETLAYTDYDIGAYEVNYTPEIAMKARKLARGDYSRDVSVAGKRSITITFKVDFQKSAAATTAPKYFKCLRACAMKETTGASGMTLVTNSLYNAVPATIEVAEMDEGATPSYVVVKAHGCMGNAKLVCSNIGEPMHIELEFKGVLNSITDRAWAARLVPTTFDSAMVEAVMGVGITMFSQPQQINTFTVDLGNDVQVFTDPSKSQGLEGARVVDRNPTMEMDPDLELIATQGDFARWTGNTTGTFQAQVGDRIQITAPAVQYVKAYSPGDREGHVTNQKSLELKRGSAGDDELKIVYYTE